MESIITLQLIATLYYLTSDICINDSIKHVLTIYSTTHNRACIPLYLTNASVSIGVLAVISELHTQSYL